MGSSARVLVPALDQTRIIVVICPCSTVFIFSLLNCLRNCGAPLFVSKISLSSSFQARDARLSENAWELEVCRCSCSLCEGPHLWARSGLAQTREGSPKRVREKPPRAFVAISPKQEPVTISPKREPVA
ncbi:hypothetical protein DEO72_LG11g641 [Vigna unguiculata]|uniref:Uncharacterized protein n=1 Tax=Vigna unguiculata TaxID=3917 RepID=A0A4D6NJ04_VIGUN|nr:hypothetical protein DEO72_LG11g641 [Vigna unguiculata]